MSLDSVNIRLSNAENNIINSINSNNKLLDEVNSDITEHTQYLKNVSARELSFNGFAQVILTSAGGTAVKADTDCVVQEDPEHRLGWNLTNTVAGTKFNLHCFNGLQETITLGSVLSAYFKAFINVNTEASSIPFLHIYTKPTGVGDAGAFYHSKIDYSYNDDSVIGIGEECVFYGETEPKTLFSNRKIKLSNKVVNGDGGSSEEVLFIVVASDSGATISAMNATVNILGFDALQNKIPLSRNLLLLSESSLTGGSTETKQDDIITELKSTLSVSETFLRATLNGDFTVPATSNNTSPLFNMSPAGNPTYRKIVIFGDTDNITDTEIYLQFSHDSSNWFTVESITLLTDPLNPLKKTFKILADSPPQWIRLLKLNTTGSLETVSVKSSRIN